MPEVTDSKGRKLSVRVLDPADMLDILEACADQSGNSGYLLFAMNVCSVQQIDDVPFPMPRTKAQIRAMASRLGNEGIAAIYSLGKDKDEAAPDVAEMAKN